MTQLHHPPATAAEPTRPSATLWRVAGGLALAHVVLLLAGFSQERSLMLGASTADARHAYVDGNVARIMAGGYVESLSFVLLIPALVFLARVIGQRSELGRWASQTSLYAGLGYVVVTLATGMPSGAAALYNAHDGASLETSIMVTDIRNFAFFLSLLLLAAQAFGLGVAALADRQFAGWMGKGGLVVGVLLLVGVAGAGIGLHDFASMLWMVWWIGVAVTLIRQARAS